MKKIVITLLLVGVAGWASAAGDVQQTWDKNCAMCHGKDGKGQTTVGRKLQIKDFTDPKIQAAFTDDQAVCLDVKWRRLAPGRERQELRKTHLSVERVGA